ncbi:glycosyltransferase family 39 protein [Haloarcula onubensis]|uniref:Glycosyltransferase family 39 protein n=1 Tax=Haloarcula onubensis TaxID=2950539 RepID=A0ABU2FND7_9EURY|nr:glycosyltransferase family 39 protein [Halomicroarcula sp. S3CR25-11]MDS0282270.1 glycosyltransferase family 39 protein [Halomicroarcula sp. S3CR25-11]
MFSWKNRYWFGPLLIFAVGLTARTAYWLYKGTSLGRDTSVYTDVCSLWVADPASALVAKKGVLYSGFTLPLCGFLSIPGMTYDHWVGFQILLSALSCVVVYQIGSKLVDDRTGLVAGLALALLWDTFNWDVYVLSDSLFTAGMVFVLWALMWHHHTRGWQSRAAVLAGMGYLLLSRPHGFPLVAGWLLYDVFQSDRKRLGIFASRAVPIGIGVSTLASLPYVVQRYELLTKWSRGDIIVSDATYVYPFITGSTDQPVQFVLTNVHHLLVMGILKAVFFFTPLLLRHSAIHMAINLTTYLPVILIGFFGLYRAYCDDFYLFRMWATPVLVLTLITAVTFVSWDLRYRAPLGPVFALAFGYAVSDVADRQSVRSVRQSLWRQD